MIKTTLQAILFAVAKPLSITQIEKRISVSHEVLREAVDALKAEMNVEDSGLHILEYNGKIQMVTNPDLAEGVSLFLKKDASGELTKPSVETLTIIAYRGPITKPEIEQIRGVNCSLILRNLLIRGLIDEAHSTERLQNVYSLSMDFLNALGITSIEDLPEFREFHDNDEITDLLTQTEYTESI